MRQTIFCNHYRAMTEHQTCSAGVDYGRFKGMKFDDRPCFCRRGKKNPGCDLAAFPTAEELAKEEEALKARFDSIVKARQAIVDQLGGPWKKGCPSCTGAVACPVCGVGTLHYSRAGYNGHIHAHCTIKSCVSWME